VTNKFYHKQFIITFFVFEQNEKEPTY
jgi:hypothetical protein